MLIYVSLDLPSVLEVPHSVSKLVGLFIAEWILTPLSYRYQLSKLELLIRGYSVYFLTLRQSHSGLAPVAVRCHANGGSSNPIADSSYFFLLTLCLMSV